MVDFASEPVGDKAVDKIPGIGPQACTLLKSIGIGSVSSLLVILL